MAVRTLDELAAASLQLIRKSCVCFIGRTSFGF